MKIYFIIFGIGLLLGFYLSVMYLPFINGRGLPVVHKEPSKKSQKKVLTDEAIYAKTFTSLQGRADSLGLELSQTGMALQKVKGKARVLQLRVVDLSKELKKDGVKTTKEDTIAFTLDEFVAVYTEKDSLYESVRTNLEAQLQTKDSALLLKDKQYEDVKASLLTCMEEVMQAAEENKALKKQYRKQKFKSRLLSGVVMLFTGAAASHLIQH